MKTVNLIGQVKAPNLSFTYQGNTSDVLVTYEYTITHQYKN